MWIPEKVGYILDKLRQNGFEGYVVGGCVRDSILGRKPGDWDITTSAKPQDIKSLFKRTVDTGIQHGTVTVLVGNEGFEVTTYRLDGKYEDHRHPDRVEFTPDLEEDLKRRDFTINAMAYNPGEGVIDLFGGMEDIRRKCVRCVGEPVERFSEDALRMLRGIRFAGQLGFEVEEKTLQAMAEMADTIQHVSAERIQVEISKLLLSKEPEKLLLVEKTGLCKWILPEFSRMLHTAQNTPHHCYSVGEHVLWTVRHVGEQCREWEKDQGQSVLSPYRGEFSRGKINLILVLAALLHDVGKPDCKTTDEDGADHFYGHDQAGQKLARSILKRLRFDNDTVGMVCRLVQFHERRYDGSMRAFRRLVSQAGKELMPCLFLLQEADILSQSDFQRGEKIGRIQKAKGMFCELMERKEAVTVKELAVSGSDLIELGIKQGPAVGKVLRELLELVLVDPAKNNRKELLTEAQKRITIE